MEALEEKVRRRLESNMWYHGTVDKNWDSICRKGILVDYNRETSEALDFGYGFYLAPTAERAERYIQGMMQNTSFYDESDIAMVLGFEFQPLKWFEEDTYNTKVFSKYDDEFARFVFENRTENVAGSKQHRYDAIYGVMSDAVPALEVQNYKMGRKTKEEVIEALKKQTSMKQISLHNQGICDTISLKEAYILDKTSGGRKELNVSDYCRQ